MCICLLDCNIVSRGNCGYRYCRRKCAGKEFRTGCNKTTLEANYTRHLHVCGSRISRRLYSHRQLTLPAFFCVSRIIIRENFSIFIPISSNFVICTCVYINIYIFFSFIAEIPLSRFRTFAIKIPLFRYPCTVPFILGILFWYLCVVAYFWNSSFLSPFFSFKNFPFSMELSP